MGASGSTNSRVQDRIFASKKNGGTELNLEDCDINKLSDKLLSVKELVSLSVAHNQINTLGNIHRLSRLTSLNVSYNELATLPSSIVRIAPLK